MHFWGEKIESQLSWLLGRERWVPRRWACRPWAGPECGCCQPKWRRPGRMGKRFNNRTMKRLHGTSSASDGLTLLDKWFLNNGTTFNIAKLVSAPRISPYPVVVVLIDTNVCVWQKQISKPALVGFQKTWKLYDLKACYHQGRQK